jgi:hypothetical protein
MKIKNGNKVLFVMLEKLLLIFTIPAANDLEAENIDESDVILNHIFGKKQIIKQNEVELYLNAPRAARNQDILLWWKVCI